MVGEFFCSPKQTLGSSNLVIPFVWVTVSLSWNKNAKTFHFPLPGTLLLDVGSAAHIKVFFMHLSQSRFASSSLQRSCVSRLQFEASKLLVPLNVVHDFYPVGWIKLLWTDLARNEEISSIVL